MIQVPTKGWDSTLTAVALELLSHHHWNGELPQSFLWKQELFLLEYKPKADFMTVFVPCPPSLPVREPLSVEQGHNGQPIAAFE